MIAATVFALISFITAMEYEFELEESESTTFKSFFHSKFNRNLLKSNKNDETCCDSVCVISDTEYCAPDWEPKPNLNRALKGQLDLVVYLLFFPKCMKTNLFFLF